MQSVTVSPKYQVVIPKTIREALNLHPGQKMQVVEYEEARSSGEESLNSEEWVEISHGSF